MAVQPIDLSTIYSQMDKMGQMNASLVQNANMANRQHLEKTAQQQSQKAQTVTETSQSDESSKIKADVSQGGGAGQGLLQNEGKTSESPSEAVQKPRVYEIKDPNLGRHIDVKS
ncbi:hypothetical protein [Treponema sp.]|uniref:hypothetical protein n=1 Tax=Treponema sp. TaxID=166 RepID=UPI003EFFF742